MNTNGNKKIRSDNMNLEIKFRLNTLARCHAKHVARYGT